MDRWNDLAGRLERQRADYPVDDVAMDMLLKGMRPLDMTAHFPARTISGIDFPEQDFGLPGLVGGVSKVPGAMSKAAFMGSKEAAIAKALGKEPLQEYLNPIEKKLLEIGGKPVTEPAVIKKLTKGQKEEAVLDRAGEWLDGYNKPQASTVDKALAALDAKDMKLSDFNLDDVNTFGGASPSKGGAVVDLPGSIWSRNPKKIVATGLGLGMGGIGAGLDMAEGMMDDYDAYQDQDLVPAQPMVDGNGQPYKAGTDKGTLLTPEEYEAKLKAMGWKNRP